MNSPNLSDTDVTRRRFLGCSTAGLALSAIGTPACADKPKERRPVTFGLNADPHLLGRNVPAHEANFQRFVTQMRQLQLDFCIDLGDFGCQVAEGQTTREMHDGQLQALKHHVGVFSQLECPRYHVLGNHDVGWLKGGDETITPDDLIGHSHAGEDITKQEFLQATGTPHRYYSFDIRGLHCIVLDGNNPPAATAPRGRDGVVGGYWIDKVQQNWLQDDLARHRDQLKIVFCHEELHHTSVNGSADGGDRPFPAVGKETSYVDNGWSIRQLFTNDGRVLACFAGHKHRNRWTVYGGTHYITMAATHWKSSFATVRITDHLEIQGSGGQRSYRLPLPT